MAAVGHPGADVTQYIYPPLWAALFGPLAKAVGPLAFFNGAVVCLSLALALAALAVIRLVPPERLPPVRAALLAIAVMQIGFPFEYALWLLQIQVVLVALVLWSAERALAGREISAGMLLAVAAAIKLTPALLILAFAACGLWRAVLSFTIAGAVLLGASLALAGLEAHMLYLSALARFDGNVLLLVASPSLAAALVFAADLARGVPFADLGAAIVAPATPAIQLATRLAAVVLTAATLLLIRRVPVRARLILGIGMLYQVTVFTVGPAWLHYLMLPCLLLLWLPAVWPAGRSLGVGAAFLAPLSTLAFLPAMEPTARDPLLTTLSMAATFGFWALFAVVARTLSTAAGATERMARHEPGEARLAR
jgi:hypothetical protein